jgi:hypothetical protein
MTLKKMIIISVLFFSIATPDGQKPSRVPPKIPPFKPGMTAEEFAKWRAQIQQQKLEKMLKDLKLMERQAWKRLLRVNEQQWTSIESKYKKVEALRYEVLVRASCGGHDEQSFYWNKFSEDKGTTLISDRTLEEMTEAEKLVDDLIDLLEDEKSTNKAIRQKLEALQKVADAARNQLPKARMELEKVLTSPRQEAVFLLLGFID